MDPTRRVPPDLLAHAARFVSGELEPARPRGASTVVLMRPGDAGQEVYLLRRHSGMAFAAGMFAFPGGTVDRRDSDQAVAWAGPNASQWAERLACDAAEARALVCAAVRETFEEAGVLLAGDGANSVVDDTTGDDWERDRAGLVDRSLSFTTFLARRGLVLRSDLLAPWAHWITPEFEPRRYDTRFFVAIMPGGQRTRDVSGEADQVTWLRPAVALAGVHAGSMAMLAPTYVTLEEMAGFASPAEVLAAAETREIRTIMPSVEIVDGEGFFTGTGGADT